MRTTFEEVLRTQGMLLYKTRGISMQPMLKQGRDLVVIQKPGGRLHRYDVALYRRGGKYILHRVLKVREKDYVIRGDNTFQTEEGITEDDILGVLTGFIRNGTRYSVTDIRYLLYVRVWHLIYPVRAMYHYGRRCAGQIRRMLPRKGGA